MKRGTTPTLYIKIRMPFSKVEKVEFLFKSKVDSQKTPLIHKVYEGKEITIKESTDKDFTLEVGLTEEETRILPSGAVFMDTRITLQGGIIPETGIVQMNIKETLFEEMIKSD